MTEEQKAKLETFIDSSPETTIKQLSSSLKRRIEYSIRLRNKLDIVSESNRRYKKRHKNLQRRLSREQILNKRLYMLLELVVDRIEDGKLKELVKFELQTMKWM